MDELFSVLRHTYKRLLAGNELKKDVNVLAKALRPCMLIPDAHEVINVSHRQTEQLHMSSIDGGDIAHQEAGPSGATLSEAVSCRYSLTNETPSRPGQIEILLLQMTLTEMLSSKAQSQDPELSIINKQQYTDVLTLLIEEKGIIAEMMCLFGNPELLLSHMAANCVTSLVLFQMRTDMLNNTWLKMCLKILAECPGSNQTAECLWSITAVIKGVLKDHYLRQSGILLKLFAQLDLVFEGFYTFILPLGTSDDTQAIASGSRNAYSITSKLVSFIDLLEVLVASRIHLRSDFLCQRLVYQHVTCALQLLTSSSHYVVKKKLVLLLKKCLLCKAGEDLINEPMPSLPKPDSCLSGDMFIMANTVLHSATLEWLHQIPISEKAIHFGGLEMLTQDGSQSGPDMVFLRAVTLTLLKALEIKVLYSTTEKEERADLRVFMSQLMMLLRRHLKSAAQMKQLLHPCGWISLVFMEQDDDMVEAAKTLLTIYLHFERLRMNSDSSHRERKWAHLDHELGCNPHCIFLHLLNSIVFDHTVLLDYLISTETCFLEYFVKYLKLLRGDWQHFLSACQFCETAFQNICCAQSPTSFTRQEAAGSDINSNTGGADHNLRDTAQVILSSTSFASGSGKQQNDCRAIDPCSPMCFLSTDSMCPVVTPQSLVDYDTSDDSETELLEEACAADVKQIPTGHQDSTMLREPEHKPFTAVNKELDILWNNTVPVVIDGSNSSAHCWCVEDPSNSKSFDGLFHRAVKCLKNLRKAIARLHCKQLFPYTPTALLKLLMHVETQSEL